MLNTAAAFLRWSATCSTIFIASAVLPMDGRACDHHQFALLQTGGHTIEINVTGCESNHVILVFAAVEHVDSLDGLGQQRIDFDKALLCFRACLSNLKYFGLGFIDQVLGFAGRPGCRPRQRSPRQSAPADA